MKILNYIFALLLILNCSLFSQDTAIIKYFPLKVGNKWVYNRQQNYSPGSGKDVTKIDSTFVDNNHRYYVMKNIMYLPNGTIYSTSTSALRVDSLSGNIFLRSASSECLVDSLKSRVGDSAFSCIAWAPPYWFRCHDTNTYSIFGQNPRTKYFVLTDCFECGVSRRYAKNFGVVYKHSSAVMSSQSYSLIGCVLNGVLYGDTTLVGINQISTEIPSEFSLEQNYPNPFNPSTKIKFDIPPFSFGEGPGVRLIVYDILGREVATLVNEGLKPGTYEVEWDGSNYPSGVYFYQLSINNEQLATKKMVLVK